MPQAELGCAVMRIISIGQPQGPSVVAALIPMLYDHCPVAAGAEHEARVVPHVTSTL